MVELVELRGGLMVRVDALTLARTLEDRGYLLRAHECRLYVTPDPERDTPPPALTPEDRAAITPLRLHLLAIAGYEAP